MIVKILPAAGDDFHGVDYNDKKVDNGKGELMSLNNFPEFVHDNPNVDVVKSYLKLVSENSRTKLPQFHAVISCKGKEFSKHELNDLAVNWMKEMGYGAQPFVVTFHSDTDNNHVHIVTTRVDINTRKKINHDFERLKAQDKLSYILNPNYTKISNESLSKLFSYDFSNVNQLKTLLEANGYKTQIENDSISVISRGREIYNVKLAEINFNQDIDKKRARQLKSILEKYKDVYSNSVFRVRDNRKENRVYKSDQDGRIVFKSELQENMKRMFGVDIVFHNTEAKDPFGFTLIDNKNQSIFKGSEIAKMGELFKFEKDVVDMKLFLTANRFNVNDNSRGIILNMFPQVKDFMLFENKTFLKKEDFVKMREQTKNFIKGADISGVHIQQDRSSGKEYIINENFSYIGESREALGDKFYNRYVNGDFDSDVNIQKPGKDILDILLESQVVKKDPFEDRLEDKNILKTKKRK